MTKKFELVAEMTKEFFGRKLFRIRALISFGDVEKGDLGGWVEKEESLDQSGNARGYGDAWVSGDARVYGNARVYGDARVSGNARGYGDARGYGNARVSGDARVYGDAHYVTVFPVGSERGVLTAFRQKDNSIMVTRGCFSGTIEEFESAVNERHGDNKFGKKYRALIPFIKAQLDDVVAAE